MMIEGQEVLTADAVPLKVSLAARYVVGDPVAAVTGDQSYGHAMHFELQLGLREVLSTGTIDEILGTRSTIGPAVLERTASKLARIGIELLSVDVRDLMVRRPEASPVSSRAQECEAACARSRRTAALATCHAVDGPRTTGPASAPMPITGGSRQPCADERMAGSVVLHRRRGRARRRGQRARPTTDARRLLIDAAQRMSGFAIPRIAPLTGATATVSEGSIGPPGGETSNVTVTSAANCSVPQSI